MTTTFDGVLATPMTPFHADGTLALDLLPSMYEWLAGQGVKGVFCLGTWGGFPLLSSVEREQATVAVVQAAKQAGLQVAVNVGSPCLTDAKRFSALAVENGADALASLVPIYHSGAGYYGLDDYRAYFSRLLDGANDTPVFLYNNPRTTGVLLSPEDVVTLVADGLSGIKDGAKDPDWIDAAQKGMAERGLNAQIIPGNTMAMKYADDFNLTAITSGVSVTFPRLAARTFEAFLVGAKEKGDALYALLMTTRRIVEQAGHPALVSYGVLRRFGIHAGEARLPWCEPSAKKIDDVVAALQEVPGLAEYL